MCLKISYSRSINIYNGVSLNCLV